jgi:hypothetical protein
VTAEVRPVDEADIRPDRCFVSRRKTAESCRAVAELDIPELSRAAGLS